MSYQGFTAEDGKYEVLLELTGQVYTSCYIISLVLLYELHDACVYLSFWHFLFFLL